MISNEILEEIIEISKKGQYLSKGFIHRLYINLLEQCDPITKSKFQDFYFVENIFGGLENGAACMKIEGITKYCYHAVILDVSETKHLPFLQANLYMVLYLVHELEHLKEHYKITKNNFESRLIQNSDGMFIKKLIEDKYLPIFLINRVRPIFIEKYLEKKYQKFYLPVWNIFPDEKIAEVDAFKIIYDSLNNYPNFKEIYNEDYKFILKEYYKALLSGYKRYKYSKEFTVPLKKYLEEIKKIDKYGILDPALEKELQNFNEYSSYEKMKYGLPITIEDIQEVKKNLVKSI